MNRGTLTASFLIRMPFIIIFSCHIEPSRTSSPMLQGGAALTGRAFILSSLSYCDSSRGFFSLFIKLINSLPDLLRVFNQIRVLNFVKKFSVSIERIIYIYIFCYFLLFRATPTAYEESQVRGLIGAAAASLHHSHSNVRSKPCLQPTPQFTAMLDP